MGFFHSCYVALPHQDAPRVEQAVLCRARATGWFYHLRAFKKSRWIVVNPRRSGRLSGLAQRLSSDLATDVLAIHEFTSSHFVDFHLYRKGTLLRRIECAEHDGWVGWDVEGEPQPWESVFFSPAALEDALQQSRDPEEQEQIRALFAAGQLVNRSEHPYVTTPDAVGAALELPGLHRRFNGKGDWHTTVKPPLLKRLFPAEDP